MTAALDVTLDSVRRGGRPVSIPRSEKGPRLPRWGELQRAADDLPRHFANGENIGIIIGRRGGELGDVARRPPSYRLVLSDDGERVEIARPATG